MTTLSYNGTTINLPDDLYWSDEASWQPVVQTAERTITGALVLQVHARIAGRPITLTPDSENASWITRDTLETLMSWASIPGCEMLLSYREISYTVVWRHHDGEVITATPVVHYSDVQDGDYYTATLRFMEL